MSALREEHRQIYVIFQKKLPAAKLSAVCTVYKQWVYIVATFGYNCGLKATIKHRILFHISAITITAYK